MRRRIVAILEFVGTVALLFGLTAAILIGLFYLSVALHLWPGMTLA